MTRNNLTTLAATIVLALLTGGCNTDDRAEGPEMPRFGDPLLAEGRSVWMGTCRACHLLGIAGAPAVTDYGNWAPRIAKGMRALYAGPINGIKGDDGKYKMPPRAGNDRLADAQIERAADYMIAAVEYLEEDARGN
ncbi:MAG: c-type cytochrome [Thiohalocapsa sp.]